jgi:hypothetical protein
LIADGVNDHGVEQSARFERFNSEGTIRGR